MMSSTASSSTWPETERPERPERPGRHAGRDGSAVVGDRSHGTLTWVTEDAAQVGSGLRLLGSRAVTRGRLPRSSRGSCRPPCDGSLAVTAQQGAASLRAKRQPSAPRSVPGIVVEVACLVACRAIAQFQGHHVGGDPMLDAMGDATPRKAYAATRAPSHGAVIRVKGGMTFQQGDHLVLASAAVAKAARHVGCVRLGLMPKCGATNRPRDTFPDPISTRLSFQGRSRAACGAVPRQTSRCQDIRPPPGRPRAWLCPPMRCAGTLHLMLTSSAPLG